MRFTVDRSKWRFGDTADLGDGRGETLLLNSKGYMCCLGFCMKQLGYADDDLISYGSPFEVTDASTPFTRRFEEEGKIVDTGLSVDTVLSEEAMRINDDEDISNEERESELSNLFSKHGHEIEFVGEYPKRLIHL